MRHRSNCRREVGRGTQSIYHDTIGISSERGRCDQMGPRTPRHQQVHGTQRGRDCARAAEDEYGQDPEERAERLGERKAARWRVM